MERISAGKCFAQTARDRFGHHARATRLRELADLQPFITVPPVWPNLDPDSERPSMFEIVPAMQKFRNNLTALSQNYNLYFAAYQGRIFVYRPCRAMEQTIPSHPDLQLAPEPSRASHFVGGTLDERRPHQINHIVTGFLGHYEILVAAYDDGDVVAYYVKDLEVRIPGGQFGEADMRAADEPIRKLLHENVAKSAWGIAVHGKSRLIAVSSNRHEVTIFAFGLTKRRVGAEHPTNAPGAGRICCPFGNHDEVLRRERNWRIIIVFGTRCDNIPNICFVDDDKGAANKICAIDINGAVWLADIWKAHTPPICLEAYPNMFSEEPQHGISRGWGVLVLPESSFRTVEQLGDLFGISENSLSILGSTKNHPPLVDTSPSLVGIRGNPCHIPEAGGRPPPPAPPLQIHPLPGMLLLGNFNMDEMAWVTSSDDDEASHNEHEDGAVEVLNAHSGEVLEEDTERDTDSDGDSDVVDAEQDAADSRDSNAKFNRHRLRYDKIYWPHVGRIFLSPRTAPDLIRLLLDARPATDATVTTSGTDKDSRLLSGVGRFYLLRTYEKDFELRKIEPKSKPRRQLDTRPQPEEAGVLCRDALNTGPSWTREMRQSFRYTSRLSMVAHMPELAAVALGSPTGRVLLISLTKLSPPREHSEVTLKCGLRVDLILPTQQDEKMHRSSFRPLYGMAVGPIQEADGVIMGGTGPTTRYRLMLHYQNHDILSYEITRGGPTNRLCMF